MVQIDLAIANAGSFELYNELKCSYRISTNKPRAIYLRQVHKLCSYYSRTRTNRGLGLVHLVSYTCSTNNWSMRNRLQLLIKLFFPACQLRGQPTAICRRVLRKRFKLPRHKQEKVGLSSRWRFSHMTTS